jgi:mannose-6-phosphate isomerase-like protein (cupin superfamily)
MRRRRLLQSAAAVFPLAWMERAGWAGIAEEAPAQAHVIPAGEDRLGEHHSLGFSTIAFKVMPRETAGSLFVIEHTHLLKAGPPLHLHHAQEEYFYVMEGRALFQVGERKVELRAGDSVLGPRAVPHTFVPLGEQPARMLIAFTPAGQMEDFFREQVKSGKPFSDPADFARFGMQWVGPGLTA